ncbi:MAG: SPOR domain-containing protein [bacterium]
MLYLLPQDKAITAIARIVTFSLVTLAISGCESIGGGRSLPLAPVSVVMTQAEPAKDQTTAPATLTSPPVSVTYADQDPLPLYSSVDTSSISEPEITVQPKSTPAQYTAQYYGIDPAGQTGNYSINESQPLPVTPDPSPSVARAPQTYDGNTQYYLADGSPYPEVDEYGVPIKSSNNHTVSSSVPDRVKQPTDTAEIPPVPQAGVKHYNSRLDDDAYQPPAHNNKPLSVNDTSYQTESYSDPAAGEYAIHLASYRREENVYRGWAELRQLYPDLLSGLAARISIVDLPEQGRFLRLKAGPFASKEEANQICRVIKDNGDYCLVMKFNGVDL